MPPSGHPARVMRAHIPQFRVPIRDAAVTQEIYAVERLGEQRCRLRCLPAKYEQVRRPAVFAHNTCQIVRDLLDPAEFGERDDKSDALFPILRDPRINRGCIEQLAGDPEELSLWREMRLPPIPRLLV